MKLKNKKTGEIVEFKTPACMVDEKYSYQYDSLAELNEEWEDYVEPKDFYYIQPDGELHWVQCKVPIYQLIKFQKIGNYFGTKEQAEQAVKKLKAWKRLKDKGFKIKGWKFTPDMKQIQGNYVKIEAEIPQILINEKDIDLLFGGEE